MRPFATGRYAKALCDRCGRKIDYLDQKIQIINQRDSGMRVCPECLDKDHPQLQVGRIRIDDPQALRWARTNKAENAVADSSVAALDYPFFPPGPVPLPVPPPDPDLGVDSVVVGGVGVDESGEEVVST